MGRPLGDQDTRIPRTSPSAKVHLCGPARSRRTNPVRPALTLLGSGTYGSICTGKHVITAGGASLCRWLRSARDSSRSELIENESQDATQVVLLLALRRTRDPDSAGREPTRFSGLQVGYDVCLQSPASSEARQLGQWSETSPPARPNKRMQLPGASVLRNVG